MRFQGLVAGPDGEPRCWWATGSPDYLQYHDQEWGRPVIDDDALFERLSLEGFQSGLSWLTILRKRQAFRDAFAGFRIDRVAVFDEEDIARLLQDEGIVRNRRKIAATVQNARAAQRLLEEHGSFGRFVWSFRPARARAPRSPAGIPSHTRESVALASRLKRHGFRFVGPTTVYATMQACGLVNDHLVGCLTRDGLAEARRQAIERLFKDGPTGEGRPSRRR